MNIWQEFSDKLVKAIKDCVPKNARNTKSGTKKYIDAKAGVIDWVAGYKVLPADASEEKCDEASLAIHLLGFEFSRGFHTLLTPPSGKKRVPISEQVAEVLEECNKIALKNYFEKGVAKHVYYVIGWLCTAGSKEAKRRTDNNDIGKCILSMGYFLC